MIPPKINHQIKKEKHLVFLPIYNGKDYDVGSWNPKKRAFKGGFTVESGRIFKISGWKS